MGRLQGTHCPGDTPGGRACPGQSLEHNREDTESTAPPRAAASPAPRGSIPGPDIAVCVAPDPTTPTTAPQSVQRPSGPSTVTEMQIRGCGFKNTINEDLRRPEEHLQPGELVPRAAESASTRLPRQCSRPFSIRASPQRGRAPSSCSQSTLEWRFLQLQAPCPAQHEPEETRPSPRGKVRQEQLEHSPGIHQSTLPKVNSDAGAEPLREECWLLRRAGTPRWHCRGFLPAQGCSGLRSRGWAVPGADSSAHSRAGAGLSTPAEPGPDQTPWGWFCVSQSPAQSSKRGNSALLHCPSCSRTRTRPPLHRWNQEREGTEGHLSAAQGSCSPSQHSHCHSGCQISWDLARAKAGRPPESNLQRKIWLWMI